MGRPDFHTHFVDCSPEGAADHIHRILQQGHRILEASSVVVVEACPGQAQRHLWNKAGAYMQWHIGLADKRQRSALREVHRPRD